MIEWKVYGDLRVNLIFYYWCINVHQVMSVRVHVLGHISYVWGHLSYGKAWG